MIRTRFYYSFNDLVDHSVSLANEGFQHSLFEYWGIAFADGDNTNDLYDDIVLKYGDEFVAYIDIVHLPYEHPTKPTKAEIEADADLKFQIVKILNKIKAWLNDSQFRFDKLIDIYDENESALMNQISASSTVQFNDTPQTTNTGLDSDSYASTFTKNTSSSDPGTIMSRLAEIRAFWNSIMDEWSKEFGKKFVMYI